MAGHTAALATFSGQMMAMQQTLGEMVGLVAVVRGNVAGIADRLEGLDSRLDRLETFLRSKLNGGERK
jgi:hypothetical protein